MIREAIDRIIQLADNKIIEGVGGTSYWSKTGQSIYNPIVTPIATVDTLNAFLSALDGPELKNEDPKSLQIVVSDHKNVTIFRSADSVWKTRDVFIIAKHEIEIFPFCRQLEQEEFIIRAQCMFSDGLDKNDLINYVSSIASEEVIKADDDGISQEVITKTASHGRKETKKISPIVTLKPNRTFPDVDQPESIFMLRFTQRQGKLPLIALHEADGGAWKIQATKNISEFIRSYVEERGIAVIG